MLALAAATSYAQDVGKAATAWDGVLTAAQAARGQVEYSRHCASCHGPNGQPTVEKAPIIWGQHMFYLLTQLKDYRAGRRANDIMTPTRNGAELARLIPGSTTVTIPDCGHLLLAEQPDATLDALKGLFAAEMAA